MRATAIETQAAAGDVEALCEERSEFAFAAHPRSERRIVVAAAAHLLDEAHHVRGALRIMDVEPVPKERRNLARKPDQHPAGRACAVRGRGVQYRLEIAIVELFQYPTIRSIAAQLARKPATDEA